MKVLIENRRDNRTTELKVLSSNRTDYATHDRAISVLHLLLEGRSKNAKHYSGGGDDARSDTLNYNLKHFYPHPKQASLFRPPLKEEVGECRKVLRTYTDLQNNDGVAL